MTETAILVIFELILECFSHDLEASSYHNPQFCPLTIMLWISGSLAVLMEPQKKKHIYLSYHLFSGLSRAKTL
jgi:hypothetical protein